MDAQAVPAPARDPYRRSRGLYVVEALLEYFISILTTGTYLAKLTTTIGLSDSMTAILSAVASLSGVFQIVSIYLAHVSPVKRLVIPIQVVTQLMFAMLYVIPILNLGFDVAPIFFCAILLSNALSRIISPLKYNWFMSLVEEKKRGAYTAKLQIVSVVGGALFSLAASYFIDTFEAEGNMDGAFLTLTLTIFALTALHTLTLVFSRERPIPAHPNESPFGAVRSVLRNKKYLHVLAIIVIRTIATSLSTPFYGTYQIKELAFSMTFIAAVDIVVSAIRIGALVLFGALSLKHSPPMILRIAFIFGAASYAFVIFSSAENGAFTFTAYRVLDAIFSAATAVSLNNLIFGMAPPEDRVCALAIHSIVCGVIGFVTTIATTPLVNHVQANGFSLLGVEMHAQQLLSAIALLLTLIIIVYYNVIYKKLKG